MESYTTEAQEFKKSWGKVWWSVLIQGIITFGFGLYSLFNPGQSADTLVSLFGILLVVNGIVGLIAAITQKEEGKNSVSGSAVTIIFGGLFIALAEPISTFVFGTFLYIIAAILSKAHSPANSVTTAVCGRRRTPRSHAPDFGGLRRWPRCVNWSRRPTLRSIGRIST